MLDTQSMRLIWNLVYYLEARDALLGENNTELTFELAFQKTVAVERSRKEAQNLNIKA